MYLVFFVMSVIPLIGHEFNWCCWSRGEVGFTALFVLENKSMLIFVFFLLLLGVCVVKEVIMSLLLPEYHSIPICAAGVPLCPCHNRALESWVYDNSSTWSVVSVSPAGVDSMFVRMSVGTVLFVVTKTTVHIQLVVVKAF